MTTGITDTPTAFPADEPDPAPLVQPEIPPLPLPTPAPAIIPKPPSRARELVVTVLLAALVGAVVAGGFIVGVEVALGRFTFRSGNESWSGESGNLEVKANGDLLTQKGKVTVPASDAVSVFYPKPYTNPPALTWKTEGQNYFQVSDQKPTGFKVRSNVNQPWDFHWEATGVPDKAGHGWKDKEAEKK